MSILGAEGRLASLPEILDRKEARAQQQFALLQEGPCLISFSMNIPSACKSFALASAGFEEGLKQIRRALGENCERKCIRSSGITGEEALLLLDAKAQDVKARMVALEETHPLGRLWDIDVLGSDGRSLSRQELGHPRRKCLLCGEDAKVCGRSRAHSPEELFWHAAGILDAYFMEQGAALAARCVADAMTEEVSATPKPGLVDRSNSGSHTDMDYPLFLTSIAALEPFFHRFFCLGWLHWDKTDGELFSLLREEGQRAEHAMFAATGGVNTHKGMVFSAAILCGALGRLHAGLFPLSLDQLCQQCALLGAQSLPDFERRDTQTAGLRCYLELQVPGIRGEAAAGYPAARMALQALQSWKAAGAAQNEAALYALMHLIAHVTDTNMIHRGGEREAALRRDEARALLPQLRPETVVSRLEALDKSYIAANLSPGGCADLLSLAIALDLLSESNLLTGN